MTAPPAGEAASGYAFDNRVPDGARQLGALEAYLDPITVRVLRELELRPGAACLELGPGAGSIARWLAGQGGTVTAVDRDFSRLPPTPSVHTVSHDLRHGLPVAGPFDLIHARLVLEHLPNRELLLPQLADALAPGGWLVLGEFSELTPIVYTAASEADRRLFARVIDVFRNVLVTVHGVDNAWAHRVHAAMARTGLARIRTVEYAESWTGGEPGCQLHVANLRQLRDRVLAAGLTVAELDRFHELMADPRFAARSWHFVCVRGQRPG